MFTIGEYEKVKTYQKDYHIYITLVNTRSITKLHMAKRHYQMPGNTSVDGLGAIQATDEVRRGENFDTLQGQSK